MPSSTLVNVTSKMEQCFLDFHGTEGLSDEKYIFQAVAKKTFLKLSEEEKILVPMDALLLLVRTRTYIRLRYVNRNAKKNIAKYKKLYKVAT